MVWIEDQGEGTPLNCTLHFSYFRTSFSFSLWLGEWDHFTRRTETFQMISNLYSYFFVHTLHCMGFQWVLGEEERGGGKGRWWDRKYRVWTTLCVASRMLLLHMQEIVFVDSQEGLLSSRGGGGGGGGGRHTGTRLTSPISFSRGSSGNNIATGSSVPGTKGEKGLRIETWNAGWIRYMIPCWELEEEGDLIYLPLDGEGTYIYI